MLIAIICSKLLRSRPDHHGLEPLGEDKQGHPLQQETASTPSNKRRILLHIGAIYFMFGFTYVIYATFIVVSLVQDYAFSEAEAGQFWFWIGMISILSGPLFGGLSDKIGRKITLLIVFSLQATSYLLVALQLDIGWLYLSLFLYGICVWSIPPIIAATIGDNLGPERAASAFGMVTLIFGIGQISGPALAGILAEQTGTFSASYLLAFGFAATAVLLSALLGKR